MIMKEILEKAIQHWHKLNAREQAILGGGGAFLIVFLLYAVLWVPASGNIKKLKTSIPKKQQQLASMKSQARLIKTSSGKSKSRITGNVLSRVEQISRNLSLETTIETMEPQGENGVRLVIPEIEFNKLMDYINALSSQNMRVESATLDAGDIPGILSARLVLTGS